ncbi:MAG: hypothetical protein HYV97_06980 [Bdellovibrio sp.]|nr:hypothetical protein [Bdellovibrio sp.]
MQNLYVLLLFIPFVACVQQDISNQPASSKNGTAIKSGVPHSDSYTPTGYSNGQNTNANVGSVISGVITAADGVTPLVGANLYMVKDDKKIKLENAPKDKAENDNDLKENTPEGNDDEECKSDSNGRFACKGIDNIGRTKFIIEKPDVAEKEFEAVVEDDKVTEVKIQDTRVERKQVTGRWLVVPGQYDGVQLLLSQLKGCKLSGDPRFSYKLRKSLDCENAGLSVLNDNEVSPTFLSLKTLLEYQFIFINCPTDMSAHRAVIAQYVSNGGNIYFSDWASSGLDATFPGNIEFGKKNTLPGVVGSSVLNSGLKSFLSNSSVPIYFDLNAWVPINSMRDHVQIFIKGNTALLGGKVDAPITVGWAEQGKGFVFFTSYHIEGASNGANQERSLKYLLLNVTDISLRGN